jgi:beta,beta-carotene 9',10'-dioxygenase
MHKKKLSKILIFVSTIQLANPIAGKLAPASEQLQTSTQSPIIHTHQLGFTSAIKELKAVPTSVQGSIPDWLEGSFIAVGPGIFELRDSKAVHWLDGFAMVHQFSIGKGKAHYTNKVVDSFYYQDCCKKGKLRGSTPEQKKSTWSKLTSALGSNKRPVYDNTNINVACFNKQLVTLTETPHPVRIDAKTLKTKGEFQFTDTLEAHFSCAHPLFDPNTKEWFGIATQYAHTSSYIVYKMKETSSTRTPLATIPVGYPSYMHSFALTPNYIILTETPLTVSPYDLLLSDHSFIDTFTWQPKNGTAFILIDRSTGKKIGSYKTEPFFTLHHVNAVEKDGTIALDLIAYKNSDVVKGFNLKNLHNPKAQLPASHLKRFMLNLKTGKVTGNTLSPHNIELPQINPAKLMHEYQYLYALTGEHNLAHQIIKLDLHSKRHEKWDCKGCYPTEPIFIAKPDASKEDEGVILSVVLDSHAQKSFLLILDAQSFKEIGRAYVPCHIPFTVHSKFFHL